jgi:hypothetical protein
MTQTFKALTIPDHLEFIEKHPIGKGVYELTGLSIDKILGECTLEIPKEYSPGVGWLVSWPYEKLNIHSSHIHAIQILLKLMWLYSCKESTDSPLKTFVSQELAMFEAGMKLEASRRQRIEAAKKERPWPALAKWIKRKFKTKAGWINKELWNALPDSYEDEAIYRDGDKLCCSKGSHASIGFRAFCDHVRKHREKNKCR